MTTVLARDFSEARRMEFGFSSGAMKLLEVINPSE